MRAPIQPVNGQVPGPGSALPIPLYEHVKRQISEAILLGAWPPGMQLPGEVELARQFGVAVGTLRRAMADLTAEGMLTRQRKNGTVVTGRSPRHSLRFFFQFFRLHGADGSLLRSEPDVLALTRDGADKDEAVSLAVDPGTLLVRLHRLRRVAGRPVMHETVMLPLSRVPDFPTTPEAVPALIYLHLLERYGIRVSAMRENVTAALATAEDAHLLELTLPDAVLAIGSVVYDQTGAPAILSRHRATTHGYCYVNEVR